MPTAVLMGMGFTPTLALADDHPTSKSLTADEYKDCMTALEDGASASASPSPSASDESKDPSADASKDDSSGSSDKGDGTADPKPSVSPDGSGSSDSGSDDKADSTPTPIPTPTAGGSASTGQESDATASPSPSETDKNLLDDIGDAITGIFTGGSKATESASPTPSATPSASQSPTAGTDGSDGSASTGKDTSGALKDTTKKLTDTVDDTVKGATDTASKAAEDTTKAVEKAAQDAKDAAGKATSSPSPSASASTDPEDCPAATDADGAVDNDVLLPDDPWYLSASSLTLKGADYKGVVEVRTASGKVKKVLKYVISGGTIIGDLHQTVKDKQSGKTYHVQAGKGLPDSTITGGKTVMYTESISGNLFGFLPLTFDPEHPPPLNIPEIIFTNAKVTQAGQFGGTLTVPGMRQYITD
jgi:gas vesicle protein